MDVGTIVTAGTSVITLLVLVGGGFYWWGRLSSRVDNLGTAVQTLRDEVKASWDDVKASRDELLGEIRRSEQRILTALANHPHVAPEAGRPVFWFPPGMETPTPAPTDEAPVEA